MCIGGFQESTNHIELVRPKTFKSLRGILKLTSYYCKFVLKYGNITTPLTLSPKRKSFNWNEATKQDFVALNEAMSTMYMLSMPNFIEIFVLESDASIHGLGVVLITTKKTPCSGGL